METDALASSAPAVAVICAVPPPTVVTRPEPETAATDPFDVAQEMIVSLMEYPLPSLASAVNCRLVPSNSKLSDSSAKSRLTGT